MAEGGEQPASKSYEILFRSFCPFEHVCALVNLGRPKICVGRQKIIKLLTHDNWATLQWPLFRSVREWAP